RDGLEVAHLADKYDVGIFAKRRAQRLLEALRVRADLALVDEAALVLVHELDWIFDRDDVVGALLVDDVDQRGERRRLAAPGRPGDEHETFGQVAEVEHLRRQAELLGREDLERNLPEDRADALAIPEEIRAEARALGDGVRKVGI